jgi:twitching motility two-component system response regulator PilG
MRGDRFGLIIARNAVKGFTSIRCTTREDIMSQEQLNSKADGSATPAGVKKLRVLVVDDSATIRRSAETMLSNEGCEVITAENGFEALSKITRHHPDLIFVDIMMPRLDGYQTCAIIKNNADFRDTPVVMLTSKDGLFDMARGRVVGSDQYLTKPFTREELLDAVKQHTAA